MDILDWIDVGKVSAERDELLLSYFYDNGVLQSVINDSSIFLILGRKGAGKTAVFKYLQERYTEYLGQNDVLVSLSFEDYKWNIHSLLQTSGNAESLAYKQSWRFVMFVEVIKAFSEWSSENKHPLTEPVKKANNILEKLFNKPIPSIYEIIGKKLLSLSKIQLPNFGFEGGGNLTLNAGEISFEAIQNDDILRNQLSQNIENLINLLEDAVESIRQTPCRIFIAFDRVDEAWDSISIDSSRRVIAGLVSATDSISTKYKPFVRPIVFLREDIFESLSLNDANKLREDCGKLLKWDARSLFTLVLKRVNYYAQQKSVEAIDDIDNLFDRDKMRQGTTPSKYLLKRSMMRPRDLICFLSKTIGVMKDEFNDPFNDESSEISSRLSVQAIYDAEAGYSEWLKHEIADEWNAQFPDISLFFNAVQNNAYTNFTKDILVKELKNLGQEYDDVKTTNLLRFLFDNSIIGFRVGDSRLWRFKCVYPNQAFVISDEYRIHEGLVKVLSLKEPRTE